MPFLTFVPAFNNSNLQSFSNPAFTPSCLFIFSLVSGIKGDSLHGKFISYYENGIIEDSGYYYNNNQYRTWFYFNKSGQLNKMCTYTYISGEGNLLNEIVYFDSNGDTIPNKGHHFSVHAKKSANESGGQK